MSAKFDEVGGGALGAALRSCLLVVCGVLAFAPARPARAASVTPNIPVWLSTGGWRDSSEFATFRCVGSFGPRPDSIRHDSLTLTLRFMRDRATEIRSDFGGYRIYRMTNSPDSSKAVLIRRFSLNSGSELTWNASRVTKSSAASALIANASGGFQPRVAVASGLTPTAIGAGDMNGDGRLDVVTSNQGENTVSILLGNGTGGFAPNRTDLNVSLPPSDLKLFDMNGDGKLDIAVASAKDRKFTVLMSQNGGGFQLPQSIAALNGPTSLAIGDVKRDGIPDYVLACGGSDSVLVIPGKANGTFDIPIATAVGPHPSGVAVGDLNGDGSPDIAVTNAGNNTVSVFLGNGSGSFTGNRTDFPTGGSPAGVAIQDVNNDGKPDILVTNSGSNTITELLGNGAGGFTPASDVPTGNSPRGITVADVDGDGRLDLAVAEAGDNTIGVLHGDGAGAFPSRTVVPTGVSPRSVAVADLNGDGKQDLFSADFSYELPYICNGGVVNDSILTFVDPDSNGRYVKVCRLPGDREGVCNTPRDSVLILIAPPGPHDGFLTWYSVTIERRNTTDPDYEDLFLPDTLDNFARCSNPADRNTCPNLNNKLHNLAGPVEPTRGPTQNLESVLAVPNPYRGSEVWDQPGQSEIHFINLPPSAKIRIYTAAGDLVREIQHADNVRDFERWDLKNGAGQAVASGIYMYRIEAGLFHFQSRLVVIR